MTVADRHLETGRRLARRFFAMRGNRSEVHLSEAQLAALLTMAAELGQAGVLPVQAGTDAKRI